jgi:hypothetical protein
LIGESGLALLSSEPPAAKEGSARAPFNRRTIFGDKGRSPRRWPQGDGAEKVLRSDVRGSAQMRAEKFRGPEPRCGYFEHAPFPTVGSLAAACRDKFTDS